MSEVFISGFTEVFYKEETSAGFADPAIGWTKLRVTAESLTAKRNVLLNRKTDHTNSATYAKVTEGSVEGSLSCQLSADDFDDLIGGVLCNHWNLRGIWQGKARRTFSFLVSRFRAGVRHYSLYRGCFLTKLSFNFQVNSPVGFTFDVVGLSSETIFEPPSNVRYVKGSDNDFFIGMDATVINDRGGMQCLTSFTGSFGYNVNLIERCSHNVKYKHRVGGFECTANASGAMANLNDMENFAHGIYTNIAINIQYKGKGYKIAFPNALISTLTCPSQGQGVIIANMSLNCLYSKPHGTSVKIEKVSQ